MPDFNRKLGVFVQQEIEKIEKAKKEFGSDYLTHPDYVAESTQEKDQSNQEEI